MWKISALAWHVYINKVKDLWQTITGDLVHFLYKEAQKHFISTQKKFIRVHSADYLRLHTHWSSNTWDASERLHYFFSRILRSQSRRENNSIQNKYIYIPTTILGCLGSCEMRSVCNLWYVLLIINQGNADHQFYLIFTQSFSWEM